MLIYHFFLNFLTFNWEFPKWAREPANDADLFCSTPKRKNSSSKDVQPNLLLSYWVTSHHKSGLGRKDSVSGSPSKADLIEGFLVPLQFRFQIFCFLIAIRWLVLCCSPSASAERMRSHRERRWVSMKSGVGCLGWKGGVQCILGALGL